MHTLIGVVVPLGIGNVEFDDCDGIVDELPYMMGNRPLYPMRRSFGYNPAMDGAMTPSQVPYRGGYGMRGMDSPNGEVPVGAISDPSIGFVESDPYLPRDRGFNIHPYDHTMPIMRAKYLDAPFGPQPVGRVGAALPSQGEYRAGPFIRERFGYNADPYAHDLADQRVKYRDNPTGDLPIGGLVNVGRVVLGPTQGNYRYGPFVRERWGYNADPYEHDLALQRVKYRDNPTGDLPVGAVAVGAMAGGKNPSADAASDFYDWAHGKGYISKYAEDYGWQSTDNTAHGVVVCCETSHCGRAVEQAAKAYARKHGLSDANVQFHELSNAGYYLVVFTQDADATVKEIASGMYVPESGAIFVATAGAELEAIEGGFFKRLAALFKKKPKEAEAAAPVKAAAGVGRMMTRQRQQPRSAQQIRQNTRQRVMSRMGMQQGSKAAQSPQAFQAQLAQQAGHPAAAPSSPSTPQGYSADDQGQGGYDPGQSFDPYTPMQPMPQPVYMPAPYPAPAPVYYQPSVPYPAPVAYPVRGSLR